MSPKLTFELDGEGLPIRLDLFIRHEAPDLSRTEVQRLIRSGAATVNGKAVVTPSAKVDAGDRVEFDAHLDMPCPTRHRCRKTSISVLPMKMSM